MLRAGRNNRSGNLLLSLQESETQSSALCCRGDPDLFVGGGQRQVTTSIFSLRSSSLSSSASKDVGLQPLQPQSRCNHATIQNELFYINRLKLIVKAYMFYRFYISAEMQPLLGEGGCVLCVKLALHDPSVRSRARLLPFKLRGKRWEGGVST